MCTRARLVQADRTSEWFGMPMDNAPQPSADFSLQPGQPAYLEVTIDPAAHGDRGLGPIERMVSLKTTEGQTIEFTLNANVVR